MRLLFHAIIIITCSLLVRISFDLEMEIAPTAAAQSEFDGCLLEIDRCYQGLNSIKTNLPLQWNVERIYNRALEDFRSTKSNDVAMCTLYLERLCQMWEQYQIDENYTGVDVDNLYAAEVLIREREKAVGEAYQRQPIRQRRMQSKPDDYPDYSRDRDEEDDWYYEDCIIEGESPDYCEEFR